MTSNEIDPIEMAKLAEVPSVKAAFDLWQEARANQTTAAGGPSSGRIAVEQAKAAWQSELRKAFEVVS